MEERESEESVYDYGTNFICISDYQSVFNNNCAVDLYVVTKVKQIKNKDDVKKSKRKEKSEEYKKYQRYIRSKEFDVVRKAVRERDKVCQCCGRTQEEVDADDKVTFSTHHRSYAHLFQADEEEIGDCILLCSVCHRACHSAKKNLRRFSH